MKHVRSDDETQQIRAVLAASGYAGLGKEYEDSLEEEKRMLMETAESEAGVLAREKSELEEMTKELRRVRKELAIRERRAVDARGRETLGWAFREKLKSQKEELEEYGRRVETELSQREYFAETREEEEMERELMSRDRLVGDLLSEARSRAELTIESCKETQEEKLDGLVYELQQTHVLEHVQTVRQSREAAKVLSELDSKIELRRIPTAELSASLAAVRRHGEILRTERLSTIQLNASLRHSRSSVASLRDSVNELSQRFQFLTQQSQTLRSQVKVLVEPKCSIELQCSMDKIHSVAKELLSSSLKDWSYFKIERICWLLRSDISPVAPGRAPPLVSQLRIFQDSMEQLNLESFSSAFALDHLLAHLAHLAAEATAVVPSLPSLPKFESFSSENIPLNIEIESCIQACRKVLALAPKVEVALREFQLSPAQLCLPHPDQRARLLRRLDYLRLLAHDHLRK